MSQLLFIKTLGEDYLVRSVKQIERYVETHNNVSLKVEFMDDSVRVYDATVLLLNIRVAI
jgi:hypothetical protein